LQCPFWLLIKSVVQAYVVELAQTCPWISHNASYTRFFVKECSWLTTKIGGYMTSNEEAFITDLQGVPDSLPGSRLHFLAFGHTGRVLPSILPSVHSSVHC
jgi:hypothetical protein